VLEFGTREGVRNSKQAGFGSDFRIRRGDYCLVSGQEDPRTGWGHVLALNISAYEQDLEAYFNYDVVIDRLRAQPGALVGAAHVANRGFFKGFPLYVTTGAFDFIELLQFAHINTATYYDFLNLGFRLSAAAGSDAPGGSTIGEVRTFVHTGSTLDVDAWFAELECGRSFVSNGPFLEFTVDGHLPGTELKVAAGDSVMIRARVLSHRAIGLPVRLAVIGNEGEWKVVSASGQEPELSLAFSRKITESQWIVASAMTDNDAFAHSSPIYVTVDGRPTWSRVRGPALAEAQIAALRSAEGTLGNPESRGGLRGVRASELRMRLQRAQQYYDDLRVRMAAD
jgi:hypothetical protein